MVQVGTATSERSPVLDFPDGPVVRNGVVAIVACGKKRGFEAVTPPRATTGTWG